MKLLAIETSSPILGVALCDEHGTLAAIEAPEERASVNLIPRIQKILKKKRVKLKDVDGFAVSIGPGSFTGLRVGVTAVKGLSYATKKPIVSIATLDAIARNVFVKKDTICVLLDARKGNVYSAIYKNNNGKLKKSSGYMLMPAEKVLKKLKGEVLFIGDAITACGDIIKKKYKKAVFADKKYWYPRASVVGELGIRKFKQKKFSNTKALVPMYLYGRECNVIKSLPAGRQGKRK